jgi:hypothetical protein
MFTMSSEHTEPVPAAPRGQGWSRRRWMTAAVALIVLLGGGLCVHEPRPSGFDVRILLDEWFGTEEHAKYFAKRFVFKSWNGRNTPNWVLDRIYPVLDKDPRATLDPETGRWTVTWYRVQPDNPDWADNFKVVVSYVPDRSWHMVSIDLMQQLVSQPGQGRNK